MGKTDLEGLKWLQSVEHFSRLAGYSEQDIARHFATGALDWFMLTREEKGSILGSLIATYELAVLSDGQVTRPSEEGHCIIGLTLAGPVVKG